jgi:hypothetical protein
MATREFGGRVPEEEFKKFKEAFPQYGATNWFINEALRSFNENVRRNPAIRRAVDDAIDDMLDETLARGGLSERENVST